MSTWCFQNNSVASWKKWNRTRSSARASASASKQCDLPSPRTRSQRWNCVRRAIACNATSARSFYLEQFLWIFRWCYRRKEQIWDGKIALNREKQIILIRFNSLSVYFKVQLDVTASECSHQFDFRKAVEQLVGLALEFLLKDNCFAIDLDAQCLSGSIVVRPRRWFRIINYSLIGGNVIYCRCSCLSLKQENNINKLIKWSKDEPRSK